MSALDLFITHFIICKIHRFSQLDLNKSLENVIIWRPRKFLWDHDKRKTNIEQDNVHLRTGEEILSFCSSSSSVDLKAITVYEFSCMVLLLSSLKVNLSIRKSWVPLDIVRLEDFNEVWLIKFMCREHIFADMIGN